MNRTDALAIITEALHRTAPELDVSSIDPRGELAVEADLDSIDFLSIVTQVSDRVGRDIPERDYPRLISLASFTAYLTDTVPAVSGNS